MVKTMFAGEFGRACGDSGDSRRRWRHTLDRLRKTKEREETRVFFFFCEFLFNVFFSLTFCRIYIFVVYDRCCLV